MTREQRIEAAARATADYLGFGAGEFWKSYTDVTAVALAAAFPELMSDPPTGWVAPWGATDAMAYEGLRSVWQVDDLDDQKEVYAAMRDAHTKEQT